MINAHEARALCNLTDLQLEISNAEAAIRGACSSSKPWTRLPVPSEDLRMVLIGAGYMIADCDGDYCRVEWSHLSKEEALYR